ncbi:LysR family transcriptional regulator [Paraburkholderia fungorum]|jgi:LysR family transcriptional regulator for bpeEF and oprC|uniref:LysR family transcriptional regulator n=1 Tax=Paraburkholderia fungorum TaxID=134537 RepID=UPI0038BA67EE
MNNLNAIPLFISVGESPNLTAAGERLGLTASAVSKAVTRLEEELGQRLIHRTTRKIRLTEEGLAFLERCRHILNEVAEAEAEVAHTRATPHGRLRVQMPIGFGRIVVAPALGEFTKRYPELVLDVEMSDRIVDIATEGKDAALHIGEVRDSRVIARKLCALRFVTCASPEYLAKHGEPQIPEDLERHRCLGYFIPQAGHYREWNFEREGERIAMPVSGCLNVNNAESILDAAIAGAGIAHMATFVAAEAVRQGKLKIVLRQFASVGPNVSVLYLPNKHMSPRIRALVDFLSTLVPAEPSWDRILTAA